MNLVSILKKLNLPIVKRLAPVLAHWRDFDDKSGLPEISNQFPERDTSRQAKMLKPKNIPIGWSLLIFALFCGAAWAAILLVFHLFA